MVRGRIALNATHLIFIDALYGCLVVICVATCALLLLKGEAVSCLQTSVLDSFKTQISEKVELPSESILLSLENLKQDQFCQNLNSLAMS